MFKKISVMLMISMFCLSLAAVSNASEEESSVSWADRITVSGMIESDITRTDKSDFMDRDSDSQTDYSNTIEFAVEAQIADWITGSMLFLAEDLGTEDEAGVVIDEAIMTFGKDDYPFYAVFGVRGQPFGVYENYLISDPMTQDAYETTGSGITVGVTGPVGLDISATIYKNNDPMGKLFDSGLFETDDTAAEFLINPSSADSEISSYIASFSISPIADHLSVFASFLSEKGADDKNDTYSVGIDYNCVFIEGLALDAEYFAASKREPYTSDLGVTDTFEESVLSVSAAYALGSDPVEIALRYEKFDDDGMAEQTQTWSEKNRFSAGVSYSFFEDEDLGVSAYTALEYRKTEYEISAALNGVALDDNNEVMVKLGVGF